jgi:hypothetical protein
MRLVGIEVSDADCHTLVDLLLRVGRADDLNLAARIDRNLEREARIMALSPDECTRLLGVLDDPPEGFVELRGELEPSSRRSRAEILPASS